MLRRFLETCGRFEAGTLHDWPQETWDKIAQEQGKPLSQISRPEDTGAILARRQGIGGRLPARGAAR